jgi:hypothetical protein
MFALDIKIISNRMKQLPRAIILANQAGAGKTYSMLGYLFATTRRLQKLHNPEDPDNSGPYYPSLVLVPPALVAQYLPEVLQMFDGFLDMKVYYKSPDQLTALSQYQSYFLSSATSAVEKWYHEVPTSDPANARRFLLSSYQTWQQRTAKWSSQDNVAPAPTSTPSSTPAKARQRQIVDVYALPDLV